MLPLFDVFDGGAEKKIPSIFGCIHYYFNSLPLTFLSLSLSLSLSVYIKVDRYAAGVSCCYTCSSPLQPFKRNGKERQKKYLHSNGRGFIHNKAVSQPERASVGVLTTHQWRCVARTGFVHACAVSVRCWTRVGIGLFASKLMFESWREKLLAIKDGQQGPGCV